MYSSEFTRVVSLWSHYLKIPSLYICGEAQDLHNSSQEIHLHHLHWILLTSPIQGHEADTLPHWPSFVPENLLKKFQWSSKYKRTLRKKGGKKWMFCNTSQKKSCFKLQTAFLPQIVFLIYQNTCALKYKCVQLNWLQVLTAQFRYFARSIRTIKIAELIPHVI